MRLPNGRRALVGVLSAFILAGCAPGAVTPTTLASPATPTLTSTSAAQAATATATEIVPTATATPTPIPTPRTITAGDPSSFQVIRHSWVDPAPSELFTGEISPDGRLLALGGCDLDEEAGYCFDRTVLRLYDADTGRAIRDLDFLSPVIEVLAFSPDSTLVAVEGCDLPLYLVGESETNCDQPRLWINDLASGEVRHDLDALESNVTSLVFSPDGSRLYAGVNYSTQWDETDNEIRIYDTATGERIGWIETAVGNCTSMHLEITPDGRFLVMDGRARCSWPSMVRWWEVSDPSRPRDIHQEEFVSRHWLSPSGASILVQNPLNESLMLFDVESGERLAFFSRIDANALFTFLDEDHLLVRVDRNLGVFDLNAGTITQEIVPSSYEYFGDYALTPDRGTLITLGSPQGLVSFYTGIDVWDTRTWLAPESRFLAHIVEGVNSPYANAARFSDDQRRYVVLGFLGTDVTVMGPASSEQSVARQALLDYLGALASGDYVGAAASLRVVPEDGLLSADMPYLPDLESLIPETDPGDTAGQLEVLCATPDYPCMPVREVAYQSQVSPTAFFFMVSFADPDGEVAVWPICGEVPDPSTCDRSDGLFGYYVERQEDGTFRIVNGFPPGLEMRLYAVGQ